MVPFPYMIFPLFVVERELKSLKRLINMIGWFAVQLQLEDADARREPGVQLELPRSASQPN
jgi:hypothetical protein